ncbi:uncharacterized protein BJ212DRAFT_1297467 [Suillus subaureus]|uniref:Uncharacterized protein n=1 Tax=Suillus subaureus TaxID=48587 RepID=A0A9P7JGN4_9AGAM|nr:uncharacterized protein BJ212DRAFT_1297467 [Suillus subaureus]KAG1821009.1 hypothetical protein BJ212DRAFT_1297467 [Suillus subaureus]
MPRFWADLAFLPSPASQTRELSLRGPISIYSLKFMELIHNRKATVWSFRELNKSAAEFIHVRLATCVQINTVAPRLVELEELEMLSVYSAYSNETLHNLTRAAVMLLEYISGDTIQLETPPVRGYQFNELRHNHEWYFLLTKITNVYYASPSLI